jgi:uncharacterized protein YijF (DUF1287 family)
VKKRGKSKGRPPKGQKHDRVALALVCADGRQIDGARSQAAPPAGYAADDRRALALLLLPFLIVAMSLGLSQTLKPASRMIEATARRPAPAIASPAQPGQIAFMPLSLPTLAPEKLRVAPLPQAAAVIVPPAPFMLPSQPPTLATPPQVIAVIVPSLPFALPPLPPALAAPPQTAAVIVPPAPFVLPAAPPPQLAAHIVPAAPFALPSAPPAIRAPDIVALPNTAICLPAPKRVALATPPAVAEFGTKLAQAAQAQTGDFVIYSAAYKRIAYPMGDIPSLYGSCSDVVIRAYRALGIDLQELIQRARVGGGDPNIDHRRTETLRTFFAKHGVIITPSSYGEDYKPGDIVTYYRPYSRVSRAHIAVVSETIGPSGRPMIVHNRGWGPQLEDALFVDRITGHYRFVGAPHLLASSGRMASQPAGPVRAPLGLPLVKPGAGPIRPKSAEMQPRLR